MSPCCAASQMARASAASSLLHARTGAPAAAAAIAPGGPARQARAPSGARCRTPPSPCAAAASWAKYSRQLARASFLRPISPVAASTQCSCITFLAKSTPYVVRFIRGLHVEGCSSASTLALDAVRCEAPPFAPGEVGGVHTISLRAPKGAPFKQLRRVSLRSAQARPPPGRASQPPQKSPPPGTACREPTWWACDRRAPTLSPQSRVRAGRGASLRGAWVCLISWPRARASSTDSSHLFERSGLRARSELCDVATKSSKPRGVGAKAPTALSMRRGLPRHDFAACLRTSACRTIPTQPAAPRALLQMAPHRGLTLQADGLLVGLPAPRASPWRASNSARAAQYGWYCCSRASSASASSAARPAAVPRACASATARLSAATGDAVSAHSASYSASIAGQSTPPPRRRIACADCTAASSWKRPLALLERLARCSSASASSIIARVPALRVLLAERHVVAGGVAARVAARLRVQHQRQQAQRLAFVGQQRRHQAAEPDRFVGQVAPPRIGALRVGPAFGIGGVDRIEHRVQALAQRVALGHFERRCRPGGSWSWRAPGAAPSWPARPETPTRWSRRRSRAPPAASAAHARRASMPGCAHANNSPSRRSGSAARRHRRPRARPATADVRLRSSSWRRRRSASMNLRRATVSSHASGWSRHAALRASRRARRPSASDKRILGAGDVARARGQDRDQLAVAAARAPPRRRARCASPSRAFTVHQARPSPRPDAPRPRRGRAGAAGGPRQRGVEIGHVDQEVAAELLARLDERTVEHLCLAGCRRTVVAVLPRAQAVAAAHAGLLQGLVVGAIGRQSLRLGVLGQMYRTRLRRSRSAACIPWKAPCSQDGTPCTVSTMSTGRARFRHPAQSKFTPRRYSAPALRPAGRPSAPP